MRRFSPFCILLHFTISLPLISDAFISVAFRRDTSPHRSFCGHFFTFHLLLVHFRAGYHFLPFIIYSRRLVHNALHRGSDGDPCFPGTWKASPFVLACTRRDISSHSFPRRTRFLASIQAGLIRRADSNLRCDIIGALCLGTFSWRYTPRVRDANNMPHLLHRRPPRALPSRLDTSRFRFRTRAL